MKLKYLLTLVMMTINLVAIRGQSIEEIDCRLLELDSFDIKTSYIYTDSGLDTIKKRLQKTYDVFTPCEINVYEAIYKSRRGAVLSIGYIKTLPTGNRWKFAKEIQNELKIEYELPNKKTRDLLERNNINKGNNLEWTGMTSEGVIENEDEIFMHPFRSNQYAFTEIAPFPEIQKPIEVGQKWKGELSIGTGYGEWSNTVFKNKYKVIARAEKMVMGTKMKDCYKIRATQKNRRLGKSTLEYWYHPSYGFFEFNYVNPEQQTLKIILKEVVITRN